MQLHFKGLTNQLQVKYDKMHIKVALHIMSRNYANVHHEFAFCLLIIRQNLQLHVLTENIRNVSSGHVQLHWQMIGHSLFG